MLSITIPAVATLLRAKSITRGFSPFLILIWIWVITDFLGLYFWSYNEISIVNGIHFLFESQLVLYQFYSWKLIYKVFYRTTSIIFAIFWIAEVYYLVKSGGFLMTYFVCIYAFTFSLLSIRMISSLVDHEKTIVIRNPIFLICAAFILYFTFTAIMSVFRMPLLKTNDGAFVTGTYFFMYFILIICNLLYTKAIACMPTRQTSLQPY